MEPVDSVGSSGIVATIDLTVDGIKVADWVGIGGLVAAVLAIAVTIGIAWWQRITGIRDRAAEERERQLRIANREQWRAEYDEIRDLLKHGDRIAYHVVHSGPCTAAELATLQLADFKREADQLAGRGIDALREPLLTLASLTDRLTQSAVPEPAEVIAAYSTTTTGAIPENMQPRAGWLLAISQNAVGHELEKAIAAARLALRTEWGL